MTFSFKKRALLAFTALATAIYLLWRLIFTLPFDYGILAMILGVTLLVCEIVAGLESVQQYQNMASGFEPEMPSIPDRFYPHVDVLVITHNEDADIIYKTANACRHLIYPDPGKIHVYICDDTNRPEMKALAEKLGVGYCGLAVNKHAKAGNMNNAISLTNSPLIATFDADMIPRSNFLMETVPYFFLPQMKKDANGQWAPREESEIDPDERIGFIQTPQGFYNPDLFQYNLYSEARFPNEQDYFFREINVGRNRSNSALFAGSNAVFSRQALVDAGGVAINTITEDFETGIRIQAKGYRTYALAKPLAHGLAPHTVPALIAQRERWARGCIQSLRNVRLFFLKGLSLKAKISYLACAIYWWTFTRRFVYLTVPVVAVLFHVQVLVCTITQILIFWLPYYLLTNSSLAILSGNTRNQHWNNLIDTIMFPYLIVPIVKETLGLRQKKFVVTSKKVKADRQAKPAIFALPHIFLLGASLVALAICIIQAIETAALYNAIIIFWLLINSKNLFFAICFMFGRDNQRKADRFYVQLPVEVEHEGQKFAGLTTDVSESGLSVRLNFPFYLPDEQTIQASVSTDRYQAEMRCQVVHVDPPKRRGDGWRFCLQITEMDDDNRAAYSQIVFDRIHTLPRRISGNYTLYEDFKDNIEKRMAGSLERAARRHPRIKVGLTTWSTSGIPVLIQDFNYKFAWVEVLGQASADQHPDRDSAEHLLGRPGPPPSREAAGGRRAAEVLDVECAPGVRLKLKAADSASLSRESGRLYQVLNLEELLPRESFKKALSHWVRLMTEAEETAARPGAPPGSDGGVPAASSMAG